MRKTILMVAAAAFVLSSAGVSIAQVSTNAVKAASEKKDPSAADAAGAKVDAAGAKKAANTAKKKAKVATHKAKVASDKADAAAKDAAAANK